ncbi:MAG: hypothetical protein BAA01_03735 [Bacillus thermozeamaize]|uniref:Uncharacterized protein n=1 Tax=Bacillus thermozeamaize TaxID=230954 RepID=A0A1Y3PDJ6_9BACI|nr:MAG: hypothetical protein BAA01_03735 [Bacillus thermozeamaize]
MAMRGKKTMNIDGVRTTNFPYEVIDGEEHYNLHAAVVVEHITENIPREAKPAITIDYDKIPESFHRAVREKMGIKQPDAINEAETREREQKLIEFLDKGAK